MADAVAEERVGSGVEGEGGMRLLEPDERLGVGVLVDGEAVNSELERAAEEFEAAVEADKRADVHGGVVGVRGRVPERAGEQARAIVQHKLDAVAPHAAPHHEAGQLDQRHGSKAEAEHVDEPRERAQPHHGAHRQSHVRVHRCLVA